MNFHFPTAEIYLPDDSPLEEALKRTTHLCISAHQDDSLDPCVYAESLIQSFAQDVMDRLRRIG